MIQSEFPLWTDTSGAAIVIAVAGFLVCSIGEHMKRVVVNRILNEGIDGFPGLNHIDFRRTRFSNWCWSMRESQPSRYDRIVRLLNTLGIALLLGGLFMYLSPFNIAVAMGLVILVPLILCSRTTNLAASAETELKRWHSALAAEKEQHAS